MTTREGPPRHPGYSGDLAKAEPARSIRKAEGRVSRSRLIDGALRLVSVPYAVYMPEDARGRTLGACGEFGCFLLAGVR